MKKLMLTYLAALLVLAALMPVAASATRNHAVVTPTPVPVEQASPPVGNLDPSSLDWTSVREVLGLSLEKDTSRPDTAELDAFRNELLDLADMINEISAVVYASASRSSQQKAEPLLANWKVDRAQIEQLTYDELSLVRQSYRNFEELKARVETLRALLVAPDKKSGVMGTGADTVSNAFTIIPTPTPTGPGIQHIVPFPIDSASSNKQNITAGDIIVKEGGPNTPSYPFFPCGTNTRYPNPVTLAAQLAVEAAEVGSIIANATCDTLIVICPAPGGTTLPGCVAESVADNIKLALEKVNAFINDFCVPAIDAQEIKAGFENTTIIHADLEDHDRRLKTRADAIDQFLFDFRNLDLRLSIEANLASPTDDPNILFTLPSSVCIAEGPPLNATIIGRPNDVPTTERLRRCGLLEVVSDTVRSAIDMNRVAGQDVNNAEAEFAAAVAHFNAGEWKLAYARFRKAYREAVKPSQ